MNITTSQLLEFEFETFTKHKNKSYHSMSDSMLLALGMDINKKGRWFNDGLLLEERIQKSKKTAGKYERKIMISFYANNVSYCLYIYFDRPLKDRYMLQEAKNISKRFHPKFDRNNSYKIISESYSDTYQNHLKAVWKRWSNIHE